MALELELKRLVVRLVGDASKYEKMLKGAQTLTTRYSTKVRSVMSRVERVVKKAHARMGAAVRKFGRSLKLFAVGAVIGAGVAIPLAMRKIAGSIDDLAKASSKLGIPVAQLQRLQFIAGQTGVETRTLNMALQRLTRRVSEAASGTGEAKDAIKELGLSAKALEKLNAAAQFKVIQDAMSKVENQADRVRLSFKLFDSEGVSLVNTLNLTTKEFAALEKQSASMGELTAKQAKAVERMNDAWDKAKTAMGRLLQRVVARLAPMLEKVGLAVADVSIMLGGFVTDAGHNFKVMIETAVRLWTVWKGWMHGMFMRVFSIDMLKAVAKGLLKSMNLFTQFGFQVARIMNGSFAGLIVDVGPFMRRLAKDFEAGIENINPLEAMQKVLREQVAKLKLPTLPEIPALAESGLESSGGLFAKLPQQVAGIGKSLSGAFTSAAGDVAKFFNFAGEQFNKLQEKAHIKVTFSTIDAAAGGSVEAAARLAQFRALKADPLMNVFNKGATVGKSRQQSIATGRAAESNQQNKVVALLSDLVEFARKRDEDDSLAVDVANL